MRRFIIALVLTLIAPLAHADPAPTTQPIAWRAWSDDQFATAAKEHKFVLMDLEAVWCHWCHVMDETTYRDPDVARLIGEKYIAVKVDQDSRPDISNRYEDFGWPATVIFGPDGKEIVIRQGYLQPRQFASILQAVIDDPTPGPSVRAIAPVRAGGPSLTDAMRATLIQRTADTYDEQYGSWGRVQKFMDWDAVEWCMNQSRLPGPRAAANEHMAKGTLMGQLHLVDPVWGGVYQYSTDGDWDHPHFEKIMQMQAENLRTFSNAYALWKDPAYLKAASAIHSFLTHFLRSPDGAFYTSMDADLHDGEHSAAYFALNDAGRRAQGVPRIDKHVYSRENGWAINGVVAYYAATGDPAALDEAKYAANWIIANRAIPGVDGGFTHGNADPAGPYLADTLSMGRAMLSLYAATGDRAWLTRAQASADFIIAHFTAPDYVGVATSCLLVSSSFQPRPEFDEQIMAARFANLLFHFTGKSQDRKLAETAMSYLASDRVAGQRMGMVCGILLADAELTSDPLHVVIVGPKSDPAARELFATASAFYKPYKRQEWYDSAEGPLPNADVEYPPLPKSAAFICTGSACSSPAFTTADLLKKLRRATAH